MTGAETIVERVVVGATLFKHMTNSDTVMLKRVDVNVFCFKELKTLRRARNYFPSRFVSRLIRSVNKSTWINVFTIVFRHNMRVYDITQQSGCNVSTLNFVLFFCFFRMNLPQIRIC